MCHKIGNQSVSLWFKMILRHQHLNALVASIMCHNDMGPSKSFFPSPQSSPGWWKTKGWNPHKKWWCMTHRPTHRHTHVHVHIYPLVMTTSSTAQGGGGSFKNEKPIGEVSCCGAKMAERAHWWIERWLSVSPFLSLFLFLSLSLFRHLSTELPF